MLFSCRIPEIWGFIQMKRYAEIVAIIQMEGLNLPTGVDDNLDGFLSIGDKPEAETRLLQTQAVSYHLS